jgi:hypothetical protein
MGIIVPYKADADVIQDSTSICNVKDADGNVVLTVIMKAGVITIEATSHAATARIRYETIGLSFTREKIKSNDYYTVGKTTYIGPGPISDAGGNSQNVLMFKNSNKSDDTLNGDGTVTTPMAFEVARG